MSVPMQFFSADSPVGDSLRFWLWIAVWMIVGTVVGAILAYILFGLVWTGWDSIMEEVAATRNNRSGDWEGEG